ncbi:MAG: hypothetical protein U0R78_15395 [Nocardioidaceae bacterium]
MEPISLPGFADLHPFALLMLSAIAASSRTPRPRPAEVTGYDAVSIQPNAGSQGELSGLLGDPRLPPRQR